MNNYFNNGEKYDRNSQNLFLKDSDTLYRIVKIDSLNQFYIVYARYENTVFKIISKKDSLYGNELIRLGAKYKLTLKSLLNINEMDILDIHICRIENTEFRLENDSVLWDLFITKELKGLSYQPIMKNEIDTTNYK